MKMVFANACFLFGFIGFIAYLLLIVTGFLGCCASSTAFAYDKMVIIISAVALAAFVLCMYNNCYKSRKVF